MSGEIVVNSVKKTKRPLRLDREGQSTVEFALTLILLTGFVFFFLQLSLIFAFGNYAHYATFMAARAYLSAGSDQSDQTNRAKGVIVNTVKGGVNQENRDRFPGVSRGEGGGAGIAGLDIGDPHFKPGDRASSWLQGIRYTFRSRFFVLSLAGNPPKNGGAASGTPVNSVTLTSESWLGREPTESECVIQLKGVSGVYDNGC